MDQEQKIIKYLDDHGLLGLIDTLGLLVTIAFWVGLGLVVGYLATR